jgi:hypothetical protein
MEGNGGANSSAIKRKINEKSRKISNKRGHNVIQIIHRSNYTKFKN